MAHNLLLHNTAHVRRAFTLETSSRNYPQCNGFIETIIQTVKYALEKAKLSGNDRDNSISSTLIDDGRRDTLINDAKIIIKR